MNTVAWVLVLYVALDRIVTVAAVGRKIEIKPSTAVVNLITGGLLIWAIVSLAVK